MSKYTTEVRWIVENASTDDQTIDQRIDEALPTIFNFGYPIWDIEYKPTLEHKIIKHFYLREIAFETVGLWKLFLNQTLNEIMPYYNQLYLTVNKNYDFLDDVDLRETYQRDLGELTNTLYNNTSVSDNTGKTTLEGSYYGIAAHRTVDMIRKEATRTPELTTLGSDLPQTPFTDSDKYANNVTKQQGTETTVNHDNVTSTLDGTDKNETTSNSDTSTKSNTTDSGQNDGKRNVTETTTRTRKGNLGGKSKTQLLLEYRNSLINIDMLIINDLKPLFFNLY